MDKPFIIYVKEKLDKKELENFKQQWESNETEQPMIIHNGDFEIKFLHKSISELVSEAFQTACEKGWHNETREIGTVLALVHSEVSEALEEVRRNGFTESFNEELADVCIRIFDLCGAYAIDLEKAILSKMEKNKGRSYKHGGKFF